MSPDRRHLGQRLCTSTLLLIAFASVAPAQILAHPGWKSSTFAAEPWYQHAVFYQVRSGCPTSRRDVGENCGTDFHALADRLDAMQSTGIDAVIVTPPALPSLAGASAEQAIAAQSALDSFDTFTRQATARGIRVLVALPAAHADADLAGRVRFWLTRGVAGLRLEIPQSVSQDDRGAIAASARSLAGSIPGQRIVLVDADSAAAPAAAQPSTRPARRSSRSAQTTAAAPELQVITLSGPLTAASLRSQLITAFTTPNTLLDTRADSTALQQVLAALALASNSAVLADPAQPLILPATQPPAQPEDDEVKLAPPPIPQQPPPGVYLPYVPYVPPARPVKKVAPPPPPADPFTEWVARLAALHHTNVALRIAPKTVLDFDAENVLAWVAKPANPTPQNPATFVLSNLSDQPVTLSLADALKKLNLHGFFLRKLLRSDDAMGAEDIAAVRLAPHSVYIGELRR